MNGLVNGDWEALLDAVAEEVAAQVAPLGERLEQIAETVQSHRPDRLLTREEVSDLLRIDVRTLRRMVHQGDLPEPIRIGARVVRWRARDLEAFIQGD